MESTPGTQQARQTILLSFLILFPLLGLLSAEILGMFIGLMAASTFYLAMRQGMPRGNIEGQDRYALRGILVEIKAASEVGGHQRVSELMKRANDLLSGKV